MLELRDEMNEAASQPANMTKQDQDEEWEGALTDSLTVSNSLESIHHFWEYLQAALDLATDILYFIMLNHIQSELQQCYK